jgi:hypothetical protein
MSAPVPQRGPMPLIGMADEHLPDLPPDLPMLTFVRRTPTGHTVRLAAVGDIALSGGVRRHGDYAAMLAEITPLLAGDVVFGNLEVPFVQDSTPEMMFAADPLAAPALRAAGITLLNLATNHMQDFGASGLQCTLDTLCAADISAIGLCEPPGAGIDTTAARRLVHTDTNGLRIGWLGCARTHQRQSAAGPQFWEFDEAALIEAVQAARESVDALIVSIHTGYMYIDYPSPEHKTMAERVTAAGADLILMHHAHVLQGVQVIGESRAEGTSAVICYNLGNFLIDWREGNVRGDVVPDLQTDSAVFVFDLDAQGVCFAAALPIVIGDDFRVCPATGERGQYIVERLARISHDLEGDFAPLFAAQRSERNTGHILKVMAYHLRRGNIGVLWQVACQVRPRHFAMMARWLVGKIKG